MVDDRHAKVSKKAYELWEKHGRPHGRDAEHWHEAEKAVHKTEPEAASTAKQSRPRKPKSSQPVENPAQLEPESPPLVDEPPLSAPAPAKPSDAAAEEPEKSRPGRRPKAVETLDPPPTSPKAAAAKPAEPKAAKERAKRG